MNVQGQPAVPIQPGTVVGKVLLIEGVTPEGTDGLAAVTPGKVPIVKRRKQGEEGDAVDDDMSEAASRVEGRQNH